MYWISKIKGHSLFEIYFEIAKGQHILNCENVDCVCKLDIFPRTLEQI
jgi:hypothetical protein